MKTILTKEYIAQERFNHDHWKEIRDAFLYQDPHCRWCGREVIFYVLQDGEKTPKNYATIDHLYDKMDPRRYNLYPDNEHLVLACYDCNQKRHKKRQSTISKAEQTARLKIANTRRKYTPRVELLGTREEMEF